MKRIYVFCKKGLGTFTVSFYNETGKKFGEIHLTIKVKIDRLDVCEAYNIYFNEDYQIYYLDKEPNGPISPQDGKLEANYFKLD